MTCRRLCAISRSGAGLLWVALVCAVIFATTVCAKGQTLTVLHSFTGGADGDQPYAGVSFDAAGNLYGATYGDHNGAGYGMVFKLAARDAAWLETPLFYFQGPPSLTGYQPVSTPVVAPDGTVYGTTQSGGDFAQNACEIYGCGVVYKVRPQSGPCKALFCLWTEAIPYKFGSDLADGAAPLYGSLLFDSSGNLYGTTLTGCCHNPYDGSVFKLSPSNGGWTETVLYRFLGGTDGSGPNSGVIFDRSGNLYGTTFQGGGTGCNDNAGCGTVYELSPSGSGWTEKILYTFQGGADGNWPIGGLTFDPSGNLYGTTSTGGASGGGTVFKLAPSGGAWVYSLVYSFTRAGGTFLCPGPTGTLLLDAAGNLYGNSCANGAFGYGVIFKLSPSGNGWTYISLHDFTNGDDGAHPFGNLAVDRNRNLYDTSIDGGTFGRGTVFEITP